MSERGYQNTEYRFGFQGQEYDEETGTDHYTYRQADRITGRFWSVDPLAPKYPHNSPYAFSENRVIDGVELEGLEWEPIHDTDGNVTDYKWVGYEDGYVNEQGTVIYKDEYAKLQVFLRNIGAKNTFKPAKVGKKGSVPIGAISMKVDVEGNEAVAIFKTTEGGQAAYEFYFANENGMVELPHTDTYNLEGNYLPAGEYAINGETVYNIYNYEGDDQWGSPQVIADLVNMAVSYKSATGGLLNYGDLSTSKGETFAPHSSHSNGTQFDYRYSVGSASGSRKASTYYTHTSSNLARLQTFVDIAYRNGMRNFILPAATKGFITNPANGETVTRNYSKRSGVAFSGVHFLFGADHEDHGHTGR